MRPNDILVVSEIDTGAIHSCILDSLRQSTNETANPYEARSKKVLPLLGVAIIKDSLQIIFSEPEPQVQDNLLEVDVYVPAKISRLDRSVSLFELFGLVSEKMESLSQDAIINELEAVHGELPHPGRKGFDW